MESSLCWLSDPWVTRGVWRLMMSFPLPLSNICIMNVWFGLSYHYYCILNELLLIRRASASAFMLTLMYPHCKSVRSRSIYWSRRCFKGHFLVPLSLSRWRVHILIYNCTDCCDLSGAAGCCRYWVSYKLPSITWMLTVNVCSAVVTCVGGGCSDYTQTLQGHVSAENIVHLRTWKTCCIQVCALS